MLKIVGVSWHFQNHVTICDSFPSSPWFRQKYKESSDMDHPTLGMGHGKGTPLVFVYMTLENHMFNG